MGHASNPIFILADLGGGIEFLFHLFGMYEFLPENSIIEWIGHFFCDVSEHPILGQLCDNIAFIIAGVDEAQLNSYRKLSNTSTCFYLIFEFWSVLLFKTNEILCSKNSMKSLFCVPLFKTCLYLK